MYQIQAKRQHDSAWMDAGVIPDYRDWLRLMGQFVAKEDETFCDYRVLNGTEIVAELRLRDNES